MLVGKSVARRDALDKVRGQARYVDDFTPEGCWYGATVRSSIPHGRVKAIRFPSHIDYSRFVMAGPQDIPGRNAVVFLTDDLTLLADGYVRHVAEPLLLLAGPDLEEVREAARAVEVEYEPLPAVLTLAEALEKGSAEGCAVTKPVHIARGDLEAGFQAADVIVEGTYEVGHQEHVYLETNGFIAWWEKDGQLVVQGSHQCPYYVHRGMKNLFGLPDEKVRVICTMTGGAFGGKEDFPSVLAGHAALLSLKAGRPVKMIYPRGEDFTATTKRHPARTHIRMGVKRDGTFTACQVHFAIDCGAYITMSPVVLSRGCIHASGPYYYPAIQVDGLPLATHTPPNGAFRGFGVPQSFFGIERHVDRVARVLGLDPIALRRRNILKAGMITATGQLLREGVSAEEVLDAALERSHYADRKAALLPADPVQARGLGVALYMHGDGFTGSGEARLKSLVGMELLPGGHFELRTASTDMGQGTLTVFPQIAASALGVDMDRVLMAPSDTAIVPDSGPTVASRTVTIVGRVVAELGQKMRTRLLEHAAVLLGGQPADYRLEGIDVVREGQGAVLGLTALADDLLAKAGPLSLLEGYHLNPAIRWDEGSHVGDAYPIFSWGCVVTEVGVDRDTLEVEVRHMSAVHDIGTVLNPVLAAGQVEGGLAQGIGYGLSEEVTWKGGAMLNKGFTNYIIPTSLDLPPLDATFVEKPFADGPFGAKGVGELPMNGVAPALGNALADALGVELERLPMTPERILEALKQAGGER